MEEDLKDSICLVSMENLDFKYHPDKNDDYLCNGSPALVIDGKAFPPMAMTARLDKPDYIRSLGEAGLPS